MPATSKIITRTNESALSTNKVLRNTYALLSMTLIFSAITAGIAMKSNALPMNPILMIIIYFGLLFLTTRLSNSAWGIASIFALTGFLGYTLGPILNFYIHNFSNGTQLVMTALGATGFIFIGLSAYAITTKKDFSYLAGFLFAAIMIAFLLSIIGIFANIPALQLVISGAFALISSGLILFQTSLIINGGERNYIMATIQLYVALFNLFLSLLQILAAFGGNRN
jgi:modulator of FtsH protease